jgi:uncharacterized membrane protein required for colicin V production
MNLSFNWFDVALPIVLIFGIQRGRKHGMSEELLLVIKWLTIVIVGSLTYVTIGDAIADSTVFTHIASYRLAYFTMALIIGSVFLLLTKLMHGKLVGSDVFGSCEYYLGMCAGLVRYSCIVIFLLAFLNARLYTNAEISANLKAQNDAFGSDFFPTPYSLQSQVFEQSFTGKLIQKDLGFLLIKSTVQETKELRHKKPEELPE